MKTVRWRKSFRKNYDKLSLRHKETFAERLELFKENAYHPTLRRHKLHGHYYGLESIDIAPDLRALFLEQPDQLVFYYIRNHGQLYD